MKIYHYTSLEALYLILKNRTLRFTNLLNVDDLEEGATQEFEYAKQYQYISCWTEENHESIPQWSMYSKNMEGIRLGIEIVEDDIKPLFIYRKDPLIERLSPPSLFFQKTVPYLSDSGVPFFRRMKYSSDEEELKPKLISLDGDYIKINMSQLALYKSKVWEFQKEIRFVVGFSHSPLNKDFSSIKNFNPLEALEVKTALFDFIDIDLSMNFFDNLEITFGPKCPEVHKEMVEIFLREFNVDATIKDSELRIA
ncbi:DUF2971 domain-containing protein [Aerococcus mictus]|uniref:DUF2971 domain-containing protein n=1 Tax=Aerococcus mictus TaxID=2976810 RepID=UPI000DCCFE2C|nr:DUF2971 domain-containing protein [Aerococcus mictus]KAA9233716.1 DUF2971 domain-containing protein [Aerococcus mictus]MDL5183825.1 DUF2971 domain-containing protein [Aerococcus mictus]